MFFYVDESGHTGTNLFDPHQPVLYYGVLSAKTNLDVRAEDEIRRARRTLGVDRLHAADMGMGGLVTISRHLAAIQRRCEPRFDVYRIAKPDHAVISFFDQVFDQGINPAVTWTGYWTPLRYALLIKVASLFDDDLAARAWAARIDLNNQEAERELVIICRVLLSNLDRIRDERSRELGYPTRQ